jgi:outer membrane protein OmpA-like peptidoglycan-associated protein
MADTLLDSLRQMVTPATVSRLSSAYGDPAPAVEKGLSAAMLAVLGAMTSRAGNRDLMGQLLSFAKDPAIPLDMPGVPDRQGSPAASAEGIVSRLQALFLGPDTNSLASALAGYARLSRPTAASLIGIASSMVLSQLARLVRRDNLDVAALGKRLAGEQAGVRALLPTALAVLPALGGAANDVPAASTRGDDTLVAAGSVTRPGASTSWLFPLLFAVAALVALVFLLRARDSDVARDGGSPAVGTSGVITRALPGGTELRLAPGGTEARFLEYVESTSPIDSERWFEFDGVGFESDSARLRADSQGQLSNIAAILKAYPGVRAKIGGYTDNSGDAAANRRLSQERADAVAAELRRLGIAGGRLEAEGYGDQHPVAGNGTAEGRARNRRVAIRVTSR